MVKNISERFEIIDAKTRTLNNPSRFLPKTEPINLMKNSRYVKESLNIREQLAVALSVCF
ncbi:hypothetical protein ACSFC1_01670 [Pseudothermotoga sp. U03pept]|uniref:hypothetical protein n=1 Tax=Pseudothermotoga sp. U03pept TaxID=3447012 RepID=UPI003F077197